MNGTEDELLSLRARVAALENDNAFLRVTLAELEARRANAGHEFLLADGLLSRPESLRFREPPRQGCVSVVIPACNAAAFLDRAVRSVWNQTFPVDRIEVLIVDDGSTDRTPQIAASLVAERPANARVLTHEGRKNRGVAPSRQLACREATGEFIAFLDADDVFLPTRLAATIDALESDAALVAVCSLGRNVDTSGATTAGYNGSVQAGDWRGWGDDFHPPFTFDLLWRTNPIANSSLTIRREALEKVGGFPNLMAHQVEDWLLVLKLSLLAPIPCLDQELMLYTHHSGGYTQQYHGGGGREGARLELFYHLATWMLQSADFSEAGALFFRREYPRLVADHQRFFPLARAYFASGGRVASGVEGLAEFVPQLIAELETLRRVVRAKLAENRRLRDALARTGETG